MEPCKYARDSVILIVGGMGPLAGIQCYKYVLENYKSDGTDQDNLDTVIVSYPGRIENRVDYVLGRSSINPGDCVLRFIKPHPSNAYFPLKEIDIKISLFIICIY